MRTIGFFHPNPQDERSLTEMEEEFSEFCLLNLHKSVETFVSAGDSEPKSDQSYLRMVNYIRTSGSEFLVAVPNASHLGKDLESVARAIVEMEGIGATVRCFDEDFPDPIQNAFQTLGIKGVSRTRGQQIKKSMQARALSGQALGKPPFGYRIGSGGLLEVDQEEANVVELIFRLYTRQEIGFRLIVQHLNERGIQTRRALNWNVVGVRDVLRNPVYTGTYTRLGVRRPGIHEAIIPHDVFRNAQDITKSRRPLGRVAKSMPFLLSGLIKCGYCGNKMMGVTRRQSWRRKDGNRNRGVYRYYQCQSRNNQSVCGYHTWRAALLENLVIKQLASALKAGASGPNRDGAKRSQALRESKIRTAESRLVQAMKRVARGELKTGLLAEYLSELDIIRESQLGYLNESNMSWIINEWKNLDIEVKIDFLTSRIDHIIVMDEEITVNVPDVT